RHKMRRSENLKIYQNKRKPWKWVATCVNRYEKVFFFRVKRTPNNKWQRRPRFHAMINLFILSFWRDNSNFKIGIGFGKRHYSLIFHSEFVVRLYSDVKTNTAHSQT